MLSQSGQNIDELLIRYQEVARIGHDINHDLTTIAMLFQKLKEGVPRIVDTQHALLLAVHQPHTSTMEVYMEEEGHSLFYEHLHGNGACTYVMETQQPIFIASLSEAGKDMPFQMIRIKGTEPKEAFIFVPLTLREVSLGVLSVQHPQPHAYTQEDLSILQLLANHIALALSNICLSDTLRRLHETGQLLTQQLDSGYWLQAIVDKIHEATQANLVMLYAYAPALQHFISPPSFAGTLLDAASHQFLQMYQPEDVVALFSQHTVSIFTTESQNILCQPEHSQVQIWQREFLQCEAIRSTAILPLQIGEELIGILFVHFRQRQRFDSTQKLFIEGLAHYASIAIRNAHTFDTLAQRRIRDLETLQNIDRELNHVLDLKQVLTRLLELACERIPADGASIWLPHPHTAILELVAGIHCQDVDHRLQRDPLQETQGITRWVAKHKKSARVANVHQDLPWRDLYVHIMIGTMAELDVPILDEGELIGVLNFESTTMGAFSREDEEFLHTLAGQAVLAIRKAQAYEREKRLAEEGQVLNDISKEIIGQLENHRQVFKLILTKALELTHSETGVLMLYDAKHNDLWMAYEQGVVEEKKSQRHGLHLGVVGNVARNKTLLNVDLTQEPWNTVRLDYIPGARYELAVPMLAGNELRGVINIESNAPYKFTERDERLLQGLADLAVVALQQAELYDKAENEAKRFSLLYQAAANLSKMNDIEQLEKAYDIILQMAVKYKPSQVVLCRYDSTSKQLVLKRQHCYAHLIERIDQDEAIHSLVMREQQKINIRDINHFPFDVDEKLLADRTIRSLLVIPIHFKDHSYGTLGMYHQEVGYFKEADVEFFEGLAQQLASTIYRLDAEQRAQELEALSAIGHFAFELTHRWDNDLGLVTSNVNNIQAELVTLAIENATITKELEYITQSARSVLKWSRDLKYVAASGHATDIFEVISVKHIFTVLQTNLRIPPTIQVDIQAENGLAAVEIIPRLIIDCLRNLVSNAIDAMPEGGRLLLHARDAEMSIAIDVIDTGIGISEQIRGKIFDLFFSTKGSSGFGLWSARTNALKNHGYLEVKSNYGAGTTFTLFLPKAK